MPEWEFLAAYIQMIKLCVKPDGISISISSTCLILNKHLSVNKYNDDMCKGGIL